MTGGYAYIIHETISIPSFIMIILNRNADIRAISIL
jgi:hypothetical protein